ncbi:MAG: DUF6113 family protein [Nocardioidaceae bacterium]
MTRLLRHLAALAVGVLVSVAALAVHRSAFPLGLLLAVVTSYAVPWWLLRGPVPRSAASYSLGWLVVFAVAVTGRPEGDFVLAQDLRGLSLMVAGIGLVVVAVVGLTGGRRSST